MAHQKRFSLVAVLLAFALAHAYIGFGLAATVSPSPSAVPPQQLLARLTTKGNQPITVNGLSSSSGESIANESMIETPLNVDAIVDLGPLGSLDIDSRTKIKLEYEGNCIPGSVANSASPESTLQKCSVKTTVYFGCVTAHYKQGAYFQAVSQQQVLIAESDKSRKQAGTFKTCAGRPAGAAAAHDLGKLARVALAALIIGTGGIILWAVPKDSSPSTP